MMNQAHVTQSGRRWTSWLQATKEPACSGLPLESIRRYIVSLQAEIDQAPEWKRSTQWGTDRLDNLAAFQLEASRLEKVSKF